MEQLVDLFPGWKRQDLQDILNECNNDLLLAIDRISSGQVEVWHEGKSSHRKEKKSSNSAGSAGGSKDVNKRGVGHDTSSSNNSRSGKDSHHTRPNSSTHFSKKDYASKKTGEYNKFKENKRPTTAPAGKQFADKSKPAFGSGITANSNSGALPHQFNSSTNNNDSLNANVDQISKNNTFNNPVTSFSSAAVSKPTTSNKSQTNLISKPSSFSSKSQTSGTTVTTTTTSGIKIQKSINKQSWAQLVKGAETKPTADAKETVTAPAAEKSFVESRPATTSTSPNKLPSKEVSPPKPLDKQTTVSMASTSTPISANKSSMLTGSATMKAAPVPKVAPVTATSSLVSNLSQQTTTKITSSSTAPIVNKTVKLSASTNNTISSTINNAAAQIASSPKKTSPGMVQDLVPTAQSIPSAPPGLKQKSVQRTLKQDAAVVMPSATNVSSIGMRFGSLAIGSEQQSSNAQSVDATPAASSLTSPALAQAQQQQQVHQQQLGQQQQQPLSQHKLNSVNQVPVNPQQSSMVPPLGHVPMQQMHSGFGLGHMGAPEYSALYSSDPQTRAMMGYYDPNMPYNQSLPQRYQETTSTVPASTTTHTTAPGQSAQQQTPGMQPSQPYPMPYHPAYYPYYFAPNYGSNVYGNPYKNAYGYPTNPTAPATQPGQSGNMNQAANSGKGYYEDNSTLGLDYKYMQGTQSGYQTKNRRFDNGNGPSGAGGQVPSGSNSGNNPSQPMSQGQMPMNPKGGYYNYPQQRGSGNSQYWTQ